VAAVAGQIAFDGRGVSKGDVGRMAASMAHRGPDGISAWADGPVGLAHCAMHTTPEAEHERQPLADPLSGCVITADARIDNREELLQTLRPTPSDGQVITDIDLILAAYLKWGTSAPEHLIGDFAFAIWDPRERHLFCARDHIGVKPFYYHADGKSFYFATEIKAIRATSESRFDLNEERVAEFIAKQAISPDSTFFANIHRLPSAHSLIVHSDGRHEVKRYWSLDPDRETVFATDEEYEEAFRDLFTETVRCRMRTNGDFGIMLSGGLDSSSVACVARDIRQSLGAGLVDTYTAQFGYDRADESEYLQALAEQGGFRMHDVDLHGVDPLDGIDQAIFHLDQPPLLGNTYVRNHCHQMMIANGRRVLLDGAEGDITVSYGLGSLGEMVLSGDWSGLEYEMHELASTTGAPISRLFRENVAQYLPARLYHHPIRFSTGELGRAARLNGTSSARLLYHTTRKLAASLYRSKKAAKLPIISPLISDELALRSRLAERLAETSNAIRSDDFSDRRRHYNEIMEESPAIAAVREEGNHLAASVGGETRHPFFDVRLVEYCVSLPANQKLRNGYTRFIQRQGLSHTLPHKISKRMTKADLSQNFVNIIRGDPKGRMREMLTVNRDVLQPYFNVDLLDRAEQSGNVMPLWTAYTFLEWYRTVYESAGCHQPDPISTRLVESKVS